MSGYTLSHRDKWLNPVFRNLLEAGIWSWMCDAAAWKETKTRFSGKLISLKRGQLVTSERFISEGFGIGRQTVRTFLDNLQADHMITREITQSSTIITICNYDKYQSEENNYQPNDKPEPQPPSNPPLTHAQPTPNPNKKEGNEYKEDNKRNISVEFESFWKLYPKKVARKTALHKFTTARKTTELELIMDGLRQYLTSRKVIEGFICNPETWLGQERWNDDYQQEQKHETNRNSNQSGAVQAPSLPPTGLGTSRKDKLDRGFADIIAKRNAEGEARQQQIDVTPDPGLPRLTERHECHATPGMQHAERLWQERRRDD